MSTSLCRLHVEASLSGSQQTAGVRSLADKSSWLQDSAVASLCSLVEEQRQDCHSKRGNLLQSLALACTGSSGRLRAPTGEA